MKRLTLLLKPLALGGLFLGWGQAQASLSSGLVAYYTFSGNASDVSGNGNNGVLNNVSFASDRFGNYASAASFTGDASSYITINSTSLNLNPDFTVSVWINPTLGLGNDGPRIISTAGYEITSDAPPGGSLNSPDRYIEMNTPYATLRSATTVPVDTWTQIVGIWTSTQMELYINGSFSSAVTITQPPDYSRGYTPTIGKNSGADRDCYGGLIDDLRIYNRALSPDEITSLYQVESVPEPASISMLGLGFIVLMLRSKSYKHKSNAGHRCRGRGGEVGKEAGART